MKSNKNVKYMNKQKLKEYLITGSIITTLPITIPIIWIFKLLIYSNRKIYKKNNRITN